MSNISVIGSKDGPAVDERELNRWMDQRVSGFATVAGVEAAIEPKLDKAEAAATYALIDIDVASIGLIQLNETTAKRWVSA